MTSNSNPDKSPIDINGLLQSISMMQANQDPDEDAIDVDEAVGSILQGAAYETIPAKAADSIPGLEIFEDSENPGSWFWEWAWGECQDGPHDNELEALLAFAKFSSELAIELGGDDEDE
ncbi:MAG: hypothetical protein AAF821_20955 [Cyanobacteria bacterium P01_D01_bin.156]